MDMSHYCRVCRNLRQPIVLAALLDKRPGRCQICDVLRHMIQAQPEGISSTDSLNIHPREMGSPLELYIPYQMAFCIYTFSEETSEMLSIPRTRAQNCGLELNNYEDSFSFIRNCMANCTAGVNGHKTCQSQPLSPLPRRLVHIGPSKFRLIETQGELGKYAALSYCWGTEPQKHFRTLSSNLDKMKTNISWEELPPVFRDAVIILDEFGIEMIWIDALCIVQDSFRESSKMAQYYAGAYFTIAVDSSENPYVPFLGRLHPIYQPFGSSVGPHSIFCERIPRFEDVFSKDINVLLQRGWALQESALSNRILHYQACGLVWECRSMVTPHHKMEKSRMLTPDWGPSRLFSRLLTLRDGDERHAHSYSRPMSEWLSEWMELVRDYSSRSLTLYNDKLPAFSGIASAVFQKTGWTYLAGHWEENLLTSLCWFVSRVDNIRFPPFPTPMPPGEGSPSWSWASVNGKVNYPGRRHNRPIENLTVYAKVLGSECIAAGLNPFGQTRGGWVTLRGHITIARLSFDSSKLRFFLHPMNKLAAFPTHPNVDTLLETCDCTTPIFHGAKTLCRRSAYATYYPLAFNDVFVELLLIMQLDGGRRFYLVLGRSQTVNGAHVRLGLLEAVEISWKQFQDDEVKAPIVVTII